MPKQEFQKLKLKKFPQVQDHETSEAKYWKTFTITAEEKLQSSPNCIHFAPNQSDTYLVTSSSKVNLYDSKTDKVQRGYSRFQDDAFSGKFRKDGKLIVAGDKNGYVKVFDVQTKAMLRQLKRHSAAVRTTCWASDGLHMLSGSDDKTVKRWDLASGETTWSSKDVHKDYVRCLDSHPTSGDVFVSGGYDHSINMWDSRTEGGPVINIDVGEPIEHCLFSPNGTMLYTASGNEVKVWDLLSGGSLMHTFCNHQKNITCLALDGTSSRILSSGLDGHIKIYSLSTMQVVHGMRLGAPLSCVGMSPDNQKLITGFVDGNMVIRTRKQGSHGSITNKEGWTTGDDEINNNIANSNALIGKYFKGAGHAVDKTEDGMIETERVARLRPYEIQLKKFNYQQALDGALKTRNPLVVVTVLEELSRRNGLEISLSGRDENSLEPLMSFAARYVSHPRYSKLIVQVVQKVLDLYASILGQSEAIDDLFVKLHRQVGVEITFHRQIMRILGSLDGIISTSSLSMNKTNSDNNLMLIPDKL
jgi:U3 small nucleolar RNA-associated protein 15